MNIIRQKGTYAVKISCRDVENALFIREAIELAIVGRACIKATKEDVDVLVHGGGFAGVAAAYNGESHRRSDFERSLNKVNFCD